MSEIIQGSPEWFAARIGKLTASRMNDALATLKSGGQSASRKNYIAELVAERLTGQKSESFSNAAMKWGTDCEPLARSAYESIAGVFVNEIGFVDHSSIAMTGASPDGLIGEDGMLEIKCPNTATHIDWMLAGVAPKEHQNQMLWQMECAGRDWCDFVSFDPRLPVDLQLFYVRFNRDDVRIQEMRVKAADFLSEVDGIIEELNKIRFSTKEAA